MTAAPVSPAVTGPDLARSVRSYWNSRIHDAEITHHPVGSKPFFDHLDRYRFAKLDYLERLVDFAGYRGRTVLEIGTGAGIDLVRFAAGGAKTVGVDLAKAAIDLARRNLAHRGSAARLYVADGARLPFRDGTFDAVYCHGVLPYALDPSGLVREVHRVLRPGGEAIFMTYHRRSWLAWMSRVFRVGLEHDDAPVFRLQTIPEFAELLAVFRQRSIVPERFPRRSELHRGLKAFLFNGVLVPVSRALPERWIRPFGWHLMAFCRKSD